MVGFRSVTQFLLLAVLFGPAIEQSARLTAKLQRKDAPK